MKTSSVILTSLILVYGSLSAQDMRKAWGLNNDNFTISNLDTFISTGEMGWPRSLHTATLLPNGKVLIAGGLDAHGSGSEHEEIPHASAELYDPASGKFTPIGSMNTIRYRHTATLLSDGKVIITGGTGPGSPSSAELYNPSTGTFTFVSSMLSPRILHTATLLSDGNVLVVGGWSSSGALVNAELYDPTSGMFKTTGNMNTGRVDHTASLLPSGKVLVTGGRVSDSGPGSSTPFASAEIYDPVTESFIATASMSTGRALHTATLLSNGKVLIVGGFNGPSTLSTAALYDPETGTFTPISSMSTGRYSPTATLLPDGNVLIAGGDTGNGNPTKIAEIYDFGTNTFVFANTMVTGRAGHKATLLKSGQLLLAGGWTRATSDWPSLASAELFGVAQPVTDVTDRNSDQLSTKFSLSQNYPNPFNPETVIKYQVPNNAKVELTIYNLLGQKIRVLVDQKQSAGLHQIRWDGSDDFGNRVASGVYIYRLRARDFAQAKKMIFLE